MKIIQSFYQMGSNISNYRNSKNDNYLLNYYSLLLSYITLKKLYGKVTIYCNNLAYDLMLKYIPYDKIISNEINFINNKNYNDEWGLLKFYVFEQQKEPFIHIDGDVFIFNDLLTKYSNDNKYDAIAQSVDFNLKTRIYDKFYLKNKDKLYSHGLIDKNLSENSFNINNASLGYNNGVVGFKNMEFLKQYISNAHKMNNLMRKGELNENRYQTIMFEQFNFFHLALMKNYNVYTILPQDEYLRLGPNEIGNKYGYTHLLAGNKYVGNFIMFIRDKIIRDYPEYFNYMIDFEKTIKDKKIEFWHHRFINKLI